MSSLIDHSDARAEPAKPDAGTAAPSTLALSATFTAEGLQDSLAFWIRELGWSYETRFAPYNQVFQQLLDPASLLAVNRGGMNVILVRFEDWARFEKSPEPDLAVMQENVERLVSSLQTASRTFASPAILAICPASPGFAAGPGHNEFQKRMEDFIVASMIGFDTIHVLTPAGLEERYPVENPHDPHADELGHVPYTPVFFTALGTMLARKIHALRMRPYKVIALDCDETLWSGICGEDGPENVVVDDPHRTLQEMMAAQHAAGMLLCLVSKNNPEDVFDTFKLHPQMVLRLEHFVATRINWRSKALNLAELADELELGLDSFILIDDNPKECSEVESNCPDLLALPLPADAAKIPQFLRHVWAFDRAAVTHEDRQRNRLYAEQMERGRALARAASLEEFVTSLHLDVRVTPMQPEELRRTVQLTQRTNQMNFTSVRRSESELQALLASGAAECLTVHVSDRFGDYGLTGVMIYRQEAGLLRVDTFLLSCRALGRGVEHRMLAALGHIALERGLATVNAPFVRSPRNLPALLFLEETGLEYQDASPTGLLFRFPAEKATAIRYKPATASSKPESAGAKPVPAPTGRKAPPYARIALTLNDPKKILDRVRSANRGRSPSAAPFLAPRNDIEQRIADIWAESLGVQPIGVDDDFFDLGGHSLLAVELMAGIHRDLGVDLSMELVYSGAFTVAEIARAIELKEIAGNSDGQYDDLLKEIEGLSDEEVRELLAKEGDASCEFS